MDFVISPSDQDLRISLLVREQVTLTVQYLGSTVPIFRDNLANQMAEMLSAVDAEVPPPPGNPG